MHSAINVLLLMAECNNDSTMRAVLNGDQYEPNLQEVLATRNSKLWEKQSILSMIRCKNNESLPQVGNDETENIWEHIFKAKWDGLQSRNMLWNKSCQPGISKITHHEQSTIKIKSEATEAVPVWLHQALTSYLNRLPCRVVPAPDENFISVFTC